MDDYDDNPSSITKKAGIPECLILDHYRRDQTYERQWRQFSDKIVVVDDLANRPHQCDLLIDQNVNHTVSDYESLVPEDCKLAIGPAFTIFRDEFTQWRPEALSYRQTIGAVERIFVCLGGTDPNQLMISVLEVLESMAVTQKIDIAIGSGAEHLKRIQAFLKTSVLDASLHVDSEQIAFLMSRADVGIGAGGTMLWERSVLALPSITIALAENQLAASETAGKMGITTYLNANDPKLRKQLVSALSSLLNDRTLRKQYVEKSGQLIDGKGAKRIVNAIESLF